MNKIEVRGNDLSKSFELNNSLISFNKLSGNINYLVKDKVKVFIFIEKSNLSINFDINSDLEINIFSIDSTLDIKLNLNKKNIDIKYAYSTINENSNNYNLDINHNFEDQRVTVTNHGLNLKDNSLNFNINAIVPKESTGVVTNQNNKIILMGENNCFIKPNLIIDNDDIEAEHSAYLGDFNKEVLFYLETRGISLKDARKILTKSFLINKMDISYIEREIILNKIEEYWR